MPKVTFFPGNIVIHAETGERLLDILQQANQDILSICGGMGECETCVVEVQFSSKESQGKNTDLVFLQTLACQTYIDQDILIKIPDWRKLF